MSDEVDTDWDNDTTVRLEFTRQSLKVISNKLSNSYSLSYCEFTLCSVLCAVPLKFSRFKFLSMWVFFLLLCVYWWKNIPQSKLWLQQCLHAEGQIQLRWALWLNICREICHLRYLMSKIYPMNVRLKIPKQKNPNKKWLLSKVNLLWSSISLL